MLRVKFHAVVISHDHYDHLDYKTILMLAKTGVRFIVPLGVGAHLAGWGIKEERITELDWWGETKEGSVVLTAVPSRHFSGRELDRGDLDRTLWSGWAFRGPRHRAYYSGDTGKFPGFKEIGRRLGPFDLTMIEVGAYNSMWPDVHLGPEHAVQAHIDVRGRTLLPVHWGTFNLSLHTWIEPMERTLAAARKRGVTVAAPRPGESVEPGTPRNVVRWWPRIPWKTAREAPIRPTGLGKKAASRAEND